MGLRRLAILALGALLPACEQPASSEPTEPDRVIMVLFDVSDSTVGPIRERYRATFDQVLGAVDAEGDPGGVLAADIIDSNPAAHGTLPVNIEFAPCTISDVRVECDERVEKAKDGADRILEQLRTKGTDVIGGLSLAEDFFGIYRDVPERILVVLSDMVQSGRGVRFARVGDWSDARRKEMLKELPVVPLEGIRVYVVGAGATAKESLGPVEIEGIERFWRTYFQRAKADLFFYGAALPRFP